MSSNSSLTSYSLSRTNLSNFSPTDESTEKPNFDDKNIIERTHAAGTESFTNKNQSASTTTSYDLLERNVFRLLNSDSVEKLSQVLLNDGDGCVAYTCDAESETTFVCENVGGKFGFTKVQRTDNHWKAENGTVVAGGATDQDLFSSLQKKFSRFVTPSE